jgi:putative sterol carrier protein
MSDVIDFGTERWVEQLKNQLNGSEAYAEAAKSWEGDLYFIVDPKGSTLDDEVYMYLDLWHGHCRKASVPQDPAEFEPEFVITGTVKTFKQIIDDGLDPMKAIMTRKLKLRGNMAKIMRNVKAANQLVYCCTLIPTRFPLE